MAENKGVTIKVDFRIFITFAILLIAAGIAYAGIFNEAKWLLLSGGGIVVVVLVLIWTIPPSRW